ncbi:MAG: MGH1-like glycoside hydrolase domain-containing protein [Candidatus Dormibacteria bacterium]
MPDRGPVPSSPAPGPADRSGDWRFWGPYLSLRQWGTVREDYSADGDAWAYLPFEHARSRAYRWGEDGLLGICDDQQRVCLALGLWNGKDEILKERLFGLSNAQGNHGEDVKEYWHYLDAMPDGRYLRALYRYPMDAFPYQELRQRNSTPGPEIKLLDLGVFDQDRYWDIEVEYAKPEPSVVAGRISVTNRSREVAELHLLPQLWLRNTWSWDTPAPLQPQLRAAGSTLELQHAELAGYRLQVGGEFSWLVCDNETDNQLLFDCPGRSRYPKNSIGDAVLSGDPGRCNPGLTGTKAAAHFLFKVAPGESQVVRWLWSDRAGYSPEQVDGLCADGRRGADEFYSGVSPKGCDSDDRLIQRQAFAGLIWSQQHYRLEVGRWLEGDPACPPPPPARLTGRNATWQWLEAADILVMPDSWEYPWFASWDLAFHALALDPLDIDLAKQQLLLLLDPRYLREDGQLAAYEWNFSDSNPPVHAMAVWQLYVRDRNRTGKPDRVFLERSFLALLFNYGWWVNRRDVGSRDIFSGGFLGLDNISAVDRSHLPDGAEIWEADATAWVGMFAVKMFRIAAELAIYEAQYEDMALRFFKHFAHIAAALNGREGEPGLWDHQDGFYYDRLRLADGSSESLRVRSLVGLMPLAACEVVHAHTLARLPRVAAYLEAAVRNKAFHYQEAGADPYACLSLVSPHRLHQLLDRLLDPGEFLSDFGLRSLSRAHLDDPFQSTLLPDMPPVRYEPGASDERIMGGNSNWRGPVWFPTGYLLVRSLRLLGLGFGDTFTHEFPGPGGKAMTMGQIADQLSHRMLAIFRRDSDGRRPVFGELEKFQTDPGWRDRLLFHEYFHGDNGSGQGASHQTGWTALAALLVDELAVPWKPPEDNVGRWLESS